MHCQLTLTACNWTVDRSRLGPGAGLPLHISANVAVSPRHQLAGGCPGDVPTATLGYANARGGLVPGLVCQTVDSPGAGTALRFRCD